MPERLRELFRLDLRALALSRIAIGLTLVLDLVTRLRDFGAFYSDAGLVARGCVLCADGSLHNISEEVAQLLFVVHIGFALAMTVGYRTRIATVGSWLLLLSLDHRNSLILQGGDDLLLATLFFAMFLPWGERMSLDARGLPERATTVLSVASAAFLVQIALVYGLTGHYKVGDQWRVTHTAIAHALMAQQWSVAASEWVLRFPRLLKILTIAVLYFETYFPVLLFFPFFNRYVRLAIVAVLFGFHISILALMNVGMFPVISLGIALALLPSMVFRAEVTREKRAPRWLDASVAVVLAVVLSSVFPGANPRMKTWLRARLAKVGLNQYWVMFAPQGGIDVWWHVIRAERSNGDVVNLFPDERPFTLERPPRVNTLYRNQRWLKLMANVNFPEPMDTRRRLLKRSCRSGDFARAELLLLWQPILPNQTYGPRSERSLLSMSCR